jgi:hypothetical protein
VEVVEVVEVVDVVEVVEVVDVVAEEEVVEPPPPPPPPQPIIRIASEATKVPDMIVSRVDVFLVRSVINFFHSIKASRQGNRPKSNWNYLRVHSRRQARTQGSQMGLILV